MAVFKSVAQHRVAAILDAQQRIVDAAISFCRSTREVPEVDCEGMIWIESQERDAYAELESAIAGLHETVNAMTPRAKLKSAEAA